MFKSQKNVFWEALIITIMIFVLGIFAGIILENWRVEEINFLFQKSEIDLLDIKLQSEIYSELNFNCEKAIEENVKFADKIYEEGKQLEKYEKASRLTDDLIIQHKRYNILRTMLLTNSIKIKEKCENDYYEVVYFYKYNNLGLDLKAKQGVFSRLLGEVKERKGYEVLLIPIAADNDISSINLFLDRYDVSMEDLPVIIINREVKIDELQDINDLMKYFV